MYCHAAYSIGRVQFYVVAPSKVLLRWSKVGYRRVASRKGIVTCGDMTRCFVAVKLNNVMQWYGYVG